jgi:hypothetical protein
MMGSIHIPGSPLVEFMPRRRMFCAALTSAMSPQPVQGSCDRLMRHAASTAPQALHRCEM